MNALVIGTKFFHMMPIPALLTRAGFSVDVLTTSNSMERVKYITNICIATDNVEMIILANEMVKTGYKLIVIADDFTLKSILDSQLSVDEKINLLPIINPENICHIGSKIGLSATLKDNGINTPDFVIARNNDDLCQAAVNLGYPLFIKIDFSGGGEGVFECGNDGELQKLVSQSISYPLLVQKKITGHLLDLSGFFQNGELIYFSYSKILDFQDGAYSPSKVRRYHSSYQVDKQIPQELNKLGKALGANGFINITCIESTIDNRRYYFEADMRPNVWIEYQKYFGEDPSEKIRDYFQAGIISPLKPSKYSNTKDITEFSYLPRMSLFEILTNRHNCRKYFENHSDINLYKWLASNKIKMMSIQFIKPRVSPLIWSQLKLLGKLFSF